MNDPSEVWQLGRWIGRREGGAARLTWSDGELILRMYQGRIRFVEGIDTVELSLRLDRKPAGCTDLLEEARTLARDDSVAETQTMGAAKEVLQGALRRWFTDPARDLEIVEGEPDEIDGATISITHTLVELVLSDTSGEVAAAVLPDLEVILRRSDNFLDLYGPLRLSEEADLIVAKITGERTAQEVADRAPHGADEVVRLLAALVTTGILEAEVSAFASTELELLPADPQLESNRRKLPTWWIGAAAAALIIVLAFLGYIVTRPNSPASANEAGAPWALVVDMGCEPQELQRVLKKAQQHPDDLRPVAADLDSGETCWRLVWGRFQSREEAEEAIGNIPSSLKREKFDPHPIKLTIDETEAAAAPGS